MSYLEEHDVQEEVDYKEFIRSVEELENQITPELQKYVQGKAIYVLLDENYKSDYFENTTVSDLRSVENGMSMDCLVHFPEYENIILMSVRDPRKGEFRNKIKFTPPNTLSVSTRIFAPDEKGKMEITGWDGLPFLQDENFVKSFCNEAYVKDENGTDYDYLEKHAFRALTNDRRFKCGDGYSFTSSEAEPLFSQILQKIICNAFEVWNSWGVVYEYAGSEFIFPMPRKHIQKIFKKRDQEDGRRKTIAAIVKSYERQNGSKVDGHLRTANGFTIDGREFSIFIGSEDFGKMFPNTEKSYKRAKRLQKHSNTIDGTSLAYGTRR